MSGKSLKLPKMSLFSKKKTNNFLLDHMIELLLVVIIIALAIVEPAFLRPSNLLNVLRNSAMKGVIAYGMCLVMIAGEIDLSVGSQVALSAVIVAWISKTLNDVAGIPLALGAVIVAWVTKTLNAVAGVPLVLGALIGVVAAVAVGMLLGVFHAWSRHKFGMPSFIVTLATLNIMYGLAAIICGGFPITACYPDWYIFLGTGRIAGIPVPALIFVAVFFVFWFITEKTTLGRQIYAVGGNAEAARLNGISVWKTRLFVLCIVQLMCVLSGVMNSAQVRSATFGFGRGWETQIISSVVIGGTSMLGGIGTVWGTLIGVLFTVHQNHAALTAGAVLTDGAYTVDNNIFMSWYGLSTVLLSGVVWACIAIARRANRRPAPAAEGGVPYAESAERAAVTAKARILVAVLPVLYGICNGLGDYFIALGTQPGALGSSVTFPIVNGGTILFSTLIGCIFFREKFTVRTALSLVIVVAATVIFMFA